MNNLYPIIQPHFQLHLTAEDCTLFYTIKAPNLPSSSLGLKEFSQWKINPLMAHYLLLCNGILTHEAIRKHLNLPFDLVIDKGVEYLIKETQVIVMASEPCTSPTPLFITGSFDSYCPLHISLEITDYCNFRCKHCYVSSSPDKLSWRSLEDTLSLFDLLWNKGVKVIELTGGECTTHPNFKEILAYASEKFNLVALISNGYLIGKNKSLAEYISQFKNVAVQISIDGLESYHDVFRNKTGAFQAAVNAVTFLKEYNCMVRVATTVTPENIEDIEKVFLLCKSLNADSFAIATVSNFGRGKCHTCPKGDTTLKQQIVEKLGKYNDDPLFAANHLTLENMKNNKDINCGAGWRTFAVNGTSGDVRICLFLSDIGVIGNLDHDSYEDIFSTKKLNLFRHAPSPSPMLETCKSCPHQEYCNGCIAKTLQLVKEDNVECPWIRHYLS